MSRPVTLACLVVAAVAAGLPARLPAAAPTDLDRFMERVLATHDENWKKLQQYVLDERETLRVSGPGGVRLYGFAREYSWFVKEGFFERSPTTADGVTIGEAERRRYEADWIRRERRREERKAGREAAGAGGDTGGAPAAARPAAGDAGTVEAGTLPAGDVLMQSVEPRFVSAAYFLRFKFDPGQYALVGRERLDGRDVLRIEYYPTRLFTEGRARPNRRVRERDDEVEEKMNKVAVVTLWVDPALHQILRYTLDDLDMDFLPGRSLVRVDGARASMRMGEPFPGVWLPDTIEMRFSFTTATGTLDARYDVAYRDYRKADVKVRIK
ncbi:MAG: hypothetical protein AB7N90_04610 [Vicinamibacterales bacterium]